MNTEIPQSTNPLSRYFRKPAIFITLPSGGKFNTPGTIVWDNAEAKELAVYPMTARDEMAMNSPDALLSGQATVDVIHSCIPGIKDGWDLNSIDLDTVLISIRIASYGEKMNMTASVPDINETTDVELDLRQALDMMDKNEFDSNVIIDSTLSIVVRPSTYRQLTNLQLRAYEEQRLLSQVSQSKDMTPTDANKQFAQIFKNMHDLTLNNMVDAITSVKVDNQTVQDRTQINEFINNMTGEMADRVRKHINSQQTLGKLKPFKLQANEEQLAKGAPKSWDQSVAMDNSNFFVSRS